MENASILELRGKRVNLHKQMQEVHERALQNGGKDGQDDEQFERLANEIKALDKTISREERLKGIGEENSRHIRPHEMSHRTIDPRGRAGEELPVNDCPRMEAIRSIFRGDYGFKDVDLQTIHPELIRPIRRKRLTAAERRAERRNLNASSFEAGGALIPDQQFETQLLAELDAETVMRGLCTIKTLKQAKSLGYARRQARASDAEWTTELASGSDDTALKFARRELRAHPLVKRIRVSETELEESPMNVEGIVISELTYVMGTTADNAYQNGDGNNKPLGVWVPDKRGVYTDRDHESAVSLDFTSDDLVKVRGKVRPVYRAYCKWLMHPDTTTKLMLLKDGEGRYIWQAGVQLGQPDLLLGKPIVESEFSPNTYTAGKYVVLYGDFRQYTILDSIAMRIKRLNEKYADTNEIGFQFRMEGDGAPMLSEAFARLKLKA